MNALASGTWWGDVGVPLRRGDARVAQDLLDDADVDALLD